MKLMMKVMFSLVLVIVGLAASQLSDGRPPSPEQDPPSSRSIAENLSIRPRNAFSENTGARPGHPEPRFIGCWTGMGGGKLRIGLDTIKDIGSAEESVYKELDITPAAQRNGLETGEVYLLEAEEDFPKSFLARIVRMSFNSDGTVGFTTYNSYDDFLTEKLEGMGLFEKIDCKKIGH